MKIHIKSLRLMPTGMMIICCFFAPAAGADERVRHVKTCSTASRSPPITRRCVAAAVAEGAFLRATEHKINLYMITSLGPSEGRWRFVFEEGDDTHPGADGSHWFVYVDCVSGKVEIEAGR